MKTTHMRTMFACRQWSESIQAQFGSFKLIVGLSLDASKASFFRDISTFSQTDQAKSYMETSYVDLNQDQTRNNILEKLYNAIRDAHPAEGPEGIWYDQSVIGSMNISLL